MSNKTAPPELLMAMRRKLEKESSGITIEPIKEGFKTVKIKNKIFFENGIICLYLKGRLYYSWTLERFLNSYGI